MIVRTSRRRRVATTALGAAALAALVACAPSPDGPPAHDVADAAADAAEIRALLDDFLANADVASAHERFWADDLVYTSSRGTRTTKAEIMAGFGADQGEDSPGPGYSGEDVDIRLYGATAVVAFRLVSTPPDGSEGAVERFFNTGTLLKRDGVWKVVAWQATRIP